jgi:dual specificity tyrosine-phosphorylation-regulated kinase 2/3/4
MIRDKKEAPRPGFSPAKAYGIPISQAPSEPHTNFRFSQENYEHSARPRVAAAREPTLNASVRNNHSLFSFGGTNDNTTGTYDFLPSPSFDDLQSSITTSSNDLQSQFPAPGGDQNLIGEKRSVETMDTSMNEGRGTASIRTASGPRPIRSGSILRRQSLSTRQSSISSTASGASGAMDPPSAPLAMRNRRQSQYPPISGSGAAIGPPKNPRKSIGPGSVDSDYSRPVQKRRPSLASSTTSATSTQGLSDAAVSTRINIGNGGSYTEGARGLTASRAAKTKSLQPPSRQGQTRLTVGTPEHSRSSSFAGRSPGRVNGRGTNTPSSSAKRMSVMPGLPQASHATGLGARTVSPTDARRAKRLSVLQNVPSLANHPPMPHTPPTPQPDTANIRTSSRSPSMLPRKTSTPSSLRTTPDINRKSFSSGLSIGSSTSYNTSRTSTGSLQPRISQPASSRLPTPKQRSVHSSAGNNDEEEVPPVPAIPKAYESPKDSPIDPPFFNKRKSGMPFDASSINSTSTNSLSGRASIREPVKQDRESKPRHYAPVGSNSDIDQQNNATPVKKKNLQPLRLPPMNLMPLSTPTTAKIAALQEPAFSDGNITPPPRRAVAKTPSTPMTASKTSFFSRNHHDEPPDLQHMRSSSSIHHIRTESSQFDASGSESSSKPIPINNRTAARQQAVSPFISSSLPKHSGEHSYMPRSKTSGDFTNMEPPVETRPPRLTGPRAQRLTRPSKAETPTQVSSPEEPTTPSSGTSLRRKLSLGWKRTTSKNNLSISHAANERGSEYAPQPPKHENMPPPRLPASATIGSLSSFTVPSPSPSVKSTTYLDSKRRKSSASSLTHANGHDRTRSDSWGINGSPKKDQLSESRPAPTSRTTSSALHKMLSSKASTNAMRSADPWTVDLDKDDLIAEDEMKKLGSKRKETEAAAKHLDALRKRAVPREHVSPHLALQQANLNIYERGEIVDYEHIYFCGTATAAKHVGELTVDSANFGYDDDRGDYSIVLGDHILYRYEIVDILGKGSFGQVVRCIDHKTGGLVAIKIIRNKKRFHQQALVEVNILKKLREWASNPSLSLYLSF